MTNVRYQLSAEKSYKYNKNILSDSDVSFNISFTADLNDPESAGLIPYYRSQQAAQDDFFKSLVAKGFEFQRSTAPNLMGDNIDNMYSAWNETYTRVKNKKAQDATFDISINTNLPVWRLRFHDFIDYDNPNESRRLRQAFGLTPISGSISGKTKVKPGHYTTWFENQSIADRIIIDSASVSETMENGELIYSISLSWKSYDLSIIPAFKEFWS